MAIVATGTTRAKPPAPTAIAQGKPPSNSLSCTVESVHDGDTARVNCNGDRKRIRFCGIDAPETKQDSGREAARFMQRLLPKGAAVKVVPIETDRYGRTVGEIFISANDPNSPELEKFANGEIALAGLAWHYAKYSQNCPNKQVIEQAEAIARQERRGIWQGNPQPPWEWRRNQRKEEARQDKYGYIVQSLTTMVKAPTATEAKSHDDPCAIKIIQQDRTNLGMMVTSGMMVTR